MESGADNSPLVVIVGQTASGKTALAIELATRFNGEVVAADSRTVYRGMDIGTAKPTLEERALVPHHLIDIIEPNEPFTVADFKHLADKAIKDIVSRGKLPLLVGGSGLYVDAVIYNFQFRTPSDLTKRAYLQTLSVQELQNLLQTRDLPLPHNASNPRHLIRAIETKGAPSLRHALRPGILLMGLAPEKEELTRRIMRRVDGMFAQGLIDEARRLNKKYSWDLPALQTPGYKTFRRYLAGEAPLDGAREECIRSHIQYAKRQKTWFKRDKNIIWISKSEEAVDLVTTLLNK
ncbi:MAG TPA: tRNA (adenosine(37)-N6)-dimethylallyltransferase MiaA [Candidatus Saccharimonadales bacterium]|nr:tRNA (adenosine(37)-N6)-dimethylallyltransferase MiaA [Candidatus Saccharimonadales bacterium]